MTDDAHVSALALERLLAGESSPRIASHVLACDACRNELTRMDTSGKRFSHSLKSLRALDAARRADAKWKQRATAFTALATSLVALAAAGIVSSFNTDTPTQPTPKDSLARVPSPPPAAASPRRQGREVLEPRPETWPSRLRKIPLRGREVEFGQGALEASLADGPPRPFTLTHTAVDITVTGFMQEVSVTQRFTNPFPSPVEAVYVFPLPDDAAVHAMELHAGPRTIVAEIRKRADARREYEQAKAEGRRAALLDQERPNIFTQSIANLLPGEVVEVTLRYVAPLAYDDGVYTLNFPMVVGPRYIAGAKLAGQSQGTGTSPDTDVVDDASRITPPSARSGRDIEVHVHVDAGTVIEDLWSVSHRLTVDRPASAKVELGLDPYDTLPNKDLIVRWRVAGTEARAALLASGGAFALMLTPEASKSALPSTPKELVFLIDTSCSMNGAPLAAAKLAMTRAMKELRPGDTFQLIDFADRAESYSDAPLPANPITVNGAIDYLAHLPAAGGTNQLAGIRRALSRDEDPHRLRLVLLMTDGFIGNEDEILAETRRLRGQARVFGFGIGTSVNHALLSRLSDEGRGFYQYIRPDEDSAPAVERFVKRIRRPLLTDVTIDWGGLPVADVLPTPVPDLFDAQPLLVQGRYRAAATGTVMVHGKRDGKEVWLEVPVSFPEASLGNNKALSMAWARQRVEKLMLQQVAGERAEVVETVTSIGLEFHLVTKYTSLVATEKTPVTNVVTTTTVTEPTLVPDQTQNEIGLGLKGAGVGGGGQFKQYKSLTLGGKGHGRVGGEGAMESDPGTLDSVFKSNNGDDFDKAFGNSNDVAESNPYFERKRAGYIPPPPGGADVKESLGQADILEAILLKKHELAACTAKRAPGTHGKLVMSWRVLLNGTVSDVRLEPDSGLENSDPMVQCFLATLRAFRFPKHSREGQRITFPFKF